MLSKKRLKFKKISIHPITAFVLLTVLVMIISSILSALHIQAKYIDINLSSPVNEKLNPVEVEGLFNYNGLKYIISNAANNFAAFMPLSSLLMALIGLSVAHASGFIDAFIKRVTLRINNKILTFAIVFLAIVSSIINEVGYVILIPLSALIFMANGRNPMLGIIASFCGVAFGYGVSLFAGTAEINLVPLTEEAARLYSPDFHVPLLSNIIVIIIATIVLSFVGTAVIENIIAKKVGKYRNIKDEEESETKEIKVESIEAEQQKVIEEETMEKKGLKKALLAAIICSLLLAYMIIPGLPGSGLLLDMNESAYINQLFGKKAYFQDGFTFLISVMFLIVGVFYGIGAKTIKNDKELIEKSTNYLKDIGYLVAFVFVAAQFVAVFKKTNIGKVVVALLAQLIGDLPFSGVPLIVTVLLLIAVSGILFPATQEKWLLFSPTVVPLLMRNNISPQFAQFIFRAADSMTKGITPLFAYFIIYLGYLNIYNNEKEPVTIGKAISLITPYWLIIGVAWILITVLIYVVGIPLGSGVSPVL